VDVSAVQAHDQGKVWEREAVPVLPALAQSGVVLRAEFGLQPDSDVVDLLAHARGAQRTAEGETSPSSAAAWL
jgi:hypothetical protein